MTILEFTKTFPCVKFHLLYYHYDEICTEYDYKYYSLVYDPEYSYYGSTNDFYRDMLDYDWIFDIDLDDYTVHYYFVSKDLIVVTIVEDSI